MFCFPVATWIGHAAAVLGGRWGAVSQRAQAVGGSREAVYQQTAASKQAVAREQIAVAPATTRYAPRISACALRMRRCGRCGAPPKHSGGTTTGIAATGSAMD